MRLDGERVSGSTSEFAVVVGIAAGLVVRVTVVVCVVVEDFGVIDGLLSLPSIFSFSLLPNNLSHGILPRITLEAVVVAVVVETDVSIFVVKKGSIVMSNSGASAEVI